MNRFSAAAVRGALVPCGLAIVLLGCAASQPQSTVSRGLVSGVTSNNGGGMEPANFSTFGATGASSPMFDTGSMAYPAPLPQGDLRTTRTP